MTTLLQFRDAVVEAMKDGLPELLYTGVIKGTLTEEGMERLSVRSPGLLVALIGFRGLSMLDVGKFRANVVMSVFIVTEGQNRIDQGHMLLEKTALLIAGNTWGVPHARLPTEIKGEPIYDDRYKDREERTRHLQETGWFMQAISWLQEVTLERIDGSLPDARADDRADTAALGRPTDDSKWPSSVEIRYTRSAPGHPPETE